MQPSPRAPRSSYFEEIARHTHRRRPTDGAADRVDQALDARTPATSMRLRSELSIATAASMRSRGTCTSTTAPTACVQVR